MNQNNDRFSILKLERDVCQYIEFKNYYEKYQEKFNNSFFYKNYYKEKKDYWYNKYITKMKYLEDNYRYINNYTDFHRQLENNCYDNTPVIATVIPSAPPIIPVFYDD